MSSDSCSHWCYSCRQPVNLRRQNDVCPNCGGGFVQELEDITSSSVDNQTQRPRFMESVSNFLRRQISATSNTSERGRSDGGAERGNLWNPLLIFSGDTPVRMPGDGGVLEFLNEALGFRQENGGDYFVGPGVEEFFEEIVNRNQRGAPPPVSRCSIDSLPTVKISKRMLVRIRTALFVRRNLLWGLRQQNCLASTYITRIVSRHGYNRRIHVLFVEKELIPEKSGTDHSSRNSRSESRSSSRRVSARENISQNQERRRPWSSLWKFGSSRSSSRSTPAAETSSETSHQHNNYSEYSNWPFE